MEKKRFDNPYIKAMLTGFGILAMSIMLFFIIFRADEIADDLNRLSMILRPFIIGAVFAYLLTPLCNRLESLLIRHLPDKIKKSAPGWAVALSMAFGLLIIYILLILIVPQLFTSIVNLSETLPGQLDRLALRLEAMLADNEVLQSYFDSAYESVTTTFEDWLKNTVLPSFGSIMGNVGTGVLNVFNTVKDVVVGVIVAVYMLASRKLFTRQSKMILASLFSPRWDRIIRDEFAYMDRMFSGFLSGKVLDSAIIGVLCYIVCAIAGMPNTLLISVVVGLTNIIPFFGPFIGAIPSAILILVESPIKALWFLVIILVLQQLDGNVIGPRILGNTTGLSSFWVLFAIILFGGLMGFVGMIIGVPLFAVIYDIISKLVHWGLRKKGLEEDPGMKDYLLEDEEE